MKAISVPRYDKNLSSAIVYGDVSRPVPAPNQLLVRVTAASTNPTDRHIAQGEMKMLSPSKPPFVLGVDGVGEIVDSTSPSFKIGDRVAFYTGLVYTGTFAEYIAVDATSVALLPDDWTIEQGACAPLALLVAARALQRSRATAGQTLFIPGATGAIGAALSAFAVGAGLKVLGIGSSADREYAASLGISDYIDYERFTASDWKDRADIGLDAFGGESYQQVLEVVRPGGAVVSLKAMTDVSDMERMGMKVPWVMKKLLPLVFRKQTKAAQKANITLTSLASYQDGADLAVAFASAGSFRPRVRRVVPLADGLAVLHENSGKVVLLP